MAQKGVQTTIEINAKGLKNLKALRRETEQTDKAFKEMGKIASNTLKQSSLIAYIGTIKEATSLMIKLTKAQTEYIEDLNLLDVAYGDANNSGKKLVSTMSNMIGLDQKSLTKSLGVYKQMASAMGITSEASSLLSENLLKMQTDISSLYNLDFARAGQILQVTLSGNTKSIRALGGDITETSLAQTALNLGITKSIDEMNRAEKTILIYLTLERQLANANGDAAKTINSVSNQVRILHEQWAMLSRQLSSIFLPILSTILPYLNAILMTLNTIVSSVLGLLGIDVGSWADSFGIASGYVDDFEQGLNGVADASDKAKKSLRGFDKLNNILTPTKSSGSGGVGVGGSISKEMLARIKEYNLHLDEMNNKAKKIADSIREWLGFSEQANGEWKFSKVTFGTIFTSILAIVGLTAGIIKIVGLFKTLGTLLSGGAIATGMAATASSTSALTAGFGALAGVIGVSTGALLGIVAAIAALGVGIAYLQLTPAIKQMNVLKGTSKETKEALGDLIPQFDEISKNVKDLDWGDKIITKEDIKKVNTNLDKLNTDIKSKLKKQQQNALDIYDETMKKTLGKEATDEMKESINQYYDAQEKIVDEKAKKIKDILDKASDEKRALTRDEVNEINKLQQEMKENTVKNLSASEEEAKKILVNMKENASALTAEQASEIIKNSIKARDETIKNAKEQYEQQVYEASKLKEAGIINDEQYQKIIDASKKARDEAITNAEEQHQKVYAEFKNQNQDIARYIDEDTGKIKSKWAIFWEQFSEKAKTIWKALSTFFSLNPISIGIKLGHNIGNSIAKILGGKDNIPLSGGSRAEGGFVERGQIFQANEKGAEMIGTLDGKTAVANQNQIVTGIRQATKEGMLDALVSTGNQNVQVNIVAQGDTEGLLDFITFKQKQKDRQYDL